MKKIIILLLLAFAFIVVGFAIIFLFNNKTTTINTNTRWESSLSHSIKLCENDKCKSKISLEYRKYSNNYNNKQLQKKITELNKLIEAGYKSDKNSSECSSKGYSVSEHTDIEPLVFDGEDFISMYYVINNNNICNGNSKKSDPVTFIFSKKNNKMLTYKETLEAFEVTDKDMKIIYDLALEANGLTGSINDYNRKIYINPYGYLSLVIYKNNSNEYYTKDIKDIKLLNS